MPIIYDKDMDTLIVCIYFEDQLIESNAFVASHFCKEEATCTWNLVPPLLIAGFAGYCE